MRVLTHETHQQGHQHAPAKSHRGADAQHTLHLGLQQAGHSLGLVDMVRDQLAFFVIQQADFGRGDTVGGTVQEARAELFFELRHALGGGRLANAQVNRRLAEGAQVHHANKQPNGVQLIHGE